MGNTYELGVAGVYLCRREFSHAPFPQLVNNPGHAPLNQIALVQFQGNQMTRIACTLLTASLIAGCAATGPNSPSARPVLYPNATLNRVGDEHGITVDFRLAQPLEADARRATLAAPRLAAERLVRERPPLEGGGWGWVMLGEGMRGGGGRPPLRRGRLPDGGAVPNTAAGPGRGGVEGGAGGRRRWGSPPPSVSII